MRKETQTNTVRERFDAVVVNQFGLDEAPADSISLAEALGCDELDLIEVCMALEEEFGIDIDDGKLERCQTIGDLFKLVS